MLRTEKFILCGMGGSALAAGLLRVHNPRVDLLVHRDYGLPRVPEYFLRESLIVASSYSGNTEETIDAFECARKAGLHVAAVTTSGKLLELAREHGAPHIVLPSTGIQPRMAVGLMIKALAKLAGDESALTSLTALAETFHPSAFESEGQALAEALVGKVPVVYASTVNLPLAYTWKITFNETGKIPAFCHVFPELNHNEMTGFDTPESGGPRFEDIREGLNAPFAFIFLKDPADEPRIVKRMAVLEQLYRVRGLPVQTIALASGGGFEKIFSSLILASWAALYTAANYGLESTGVPMVEEFKKRIAL
ncbi:MAG: SIS domain-containing protein [Patescibacteria group bacterium]|nr:SIS domain-containing protein [Patescibacteria group bacterium]